MLSEKPLFGIGPHNIESTMRKNFRDIPKNAEIRDHLHNEYMDISVKFGIPALIFLLLMYIILYIKVSRSDSAVATIIFISLLSSQMTQSQFAHHQAISFFIVLIYLSMKKKEFAKDDTN
jgi:O-antigen ligase